MNRISFFTALIAIFALLQGCAQRADSYSQQGRRTVPVQELGSRGAQFAGQAEQLHQAAQGMNLCASGVKSQSGGANVTVGAGDQNGLVSYSINTSSNKKMECSYDTPTRVAPTPAAAAASTPSAKRN